MDQYGVSLRQALCAKLLGARLLADRGPGGVPCRRRADARWCGAPRCTYVDMERWSYEWLGCLLYGHGLTLSDGCMELVGWLFMEYRWYGYIVDYTGVMEITVGRRIMI